MSAEDIRRIEPEEIKPGMLSPGSVKPFELELAGLPFNDIGNAERLVRRFGHRITYIRGHGHVAFDEARGCWDPERGEDRSLDLAIKTVEAMRHEIAALEAEGARADEDDKAFAERLAAHYRWRRASGGMPRLRGMMDAAVPFLARDRLEFDADPFLLNVRGQTLELGPLELENDHRVDIRPRPQRSRDLITRVANVHYAPGSPAPLFRSTLAQILPDEELQTFLQRYSGYCLTGSVSEQKFVVFYGEGNNGKTTLAETIAWLMGGYASSVPIAVLMENDRRSGGDASPEIAKLAGARFVRTSEPKAGMAFDEPLIKHLTGGEITTARRLYGHPFEYMPAFKFCVHCNRRPRVRGDDDGIWRRILMVPFEVQIPQAEIDRDLGEKLKAEGPGILEWMLDGYRLWREHGLQAPKRVIEATLRYREESDRLGQFLNAVCTVSGHPADNETAAELYGTYINWCQKNAASPMTKTGFGRALSERPHVTKSRTGVVTYVGIGISTAGYEMRPSVREAREREPATATDEATSDD